MALPLHIVRASRDEAALEGRTRNLSSKGAYFVVRGDIESGAAIEFLVTLQQGLSETGHIRLRCRGRVLRLDKLAGKKRLGVAATIERYDFVREMLN